MNKPTLPPGEPQTAFASESRRKYINKTTGQPENHDRTWAGAIDLPGGGRAWAAIVADGCGGDSRGTQVAESCVAAFRAAVAGSSAAELSDLARARAWVARWGDALQATVVGGPLKGGNSTLAAAVAVRDPAAPGTLSLLLANVGDSPMFLYSGPGLHALNVTPDEPEDNPNAGAGGNGLRRAIGLTAAGGFPLMDVAIRRLPPEGGPYGLAVCSDGVTDYSKVATQGGVRTIKKLKLLNASGFRRILASGMPFASRPAAILAESLAVARGRGVAETQMDNSSVALLGVGLENGVRLPDARSARARRRFPLVPVAAAAVLLVLAGGLAAFLWPKEKTPEPDPGPYMPRKPRVSVVAPPAASNETASTASATNAVPANAAITNAAPANAAPTNAASSREAASVPGASAPGSIPTTPAPSEAKPKEPAPPPEPKPVPSEARQKEPPPPANSGKPPVPYVPKAEAKPQEKPQVKPRENPSESVSVPAEEHPPVPPPDPEAEWREAEETLDAFLDPDHRDRATCLKEMARLLEARTNWTDRLGDFYARRYADLAPLVRFVNGMTMNLSVRVGGTNEVSVPAGKEGSSRLKNARFPESGSFPYRVVPAGQCEGCWSLPPEAKVDWSWNSRVIEVPLKAPTPKDRPVWTPRLPDSPLDSWRLERKDGDRWLSIDVPKDGRIECDPHSDAEFRFDLGDRTHAWTIHAGHCGEEVKAEDKGVTEKPKFPTVRIENRGPRPVTVVVFPETNKQVRLEPFVPMEFPAPQLIFSDQETFSYEIKDPMEATKNPKSFRFDPTIMRGDGIQNEKYTPPPSEKTKIYLTRENTESNVIPLFGNLKKYLDAGKGKETNIRDILEKKKDFKDIAKELLAPENADNIYAFLRWFYSVAKDCYPEAGWSELTDTDWEKLEIIWNQLHPAPVPAAAPAPADKSSPEQKTSERADEWREYKIKKGDSLEKLAKNRLPDGSSIDQLVSEICTRNKIKDPNTIPAGQTILLPPEK